MTDIYLERHERAPLTEEARETANEIIASVLSSLDDGQPYEPIPGTIAPEKYLEELRVEARDRQQELGDEYVFFGTARKPYKYLYEALVKGYNPTEEQKEAEVQSGGHNFLWDEVMQLHINHYDISEIFRGTKERYWENVVETDVLRDVLGVMYMRGKDYRSFGYGFPWMSDEVTVEEVNIDYVGTEEMN